MALTIAINSQVVNSAVRNHTLRIIKQGAVEQAVLQCQDPLQAFRPAVGDVLYVAQDGGQLEFGGEITRVEADLDPYQWLTTVQARGWAFEADEVEVDLFTVPTSTVLGAAASSLCLEYLGGKGWTMAIGTDAGPYLQPGTYRQMTVGDIFRAWEDQTDIPWRVNGERLFGFDVGTLAAPTSFTESNRTVLRGATWSQDRVRLATRIRAVTSGRSEEYWPHIENHQANGVKTIFPVNGVAQEVEAAVTQAYSAGVSTLAVTGLPPSITLRAGLTLRAATHGPYSLASAASVDGSGNATVALAAATVGDLVEKEVVAFDNGTLVGLVVNSTTTALDGSAGWRWNPQYAQLEADVAPTSTTVVRYLVQLKHPVTVRSWAAGTQDSTGAFNPSSLRDARVQRVGDTDLVQTHVRNLTELQRRLSQPKTFTIETDYEGHLYPWMYAPCDFPSQGISGTYRIQNAEIVDIGRTNQRPRVTLDLIEGYEPDWRQDWRANMAVAATAARAGTVSGGGGGGGIGGGSAGPYVGLSLPLGGSNAAVLRLTTSWQGIPEGIPIDHPADVTGTWSFRPCAYQIASNTPSVPIELRLLIDGTPVSSLSVGIGAWSSISNNPAAFAFPSASYAAPPGGACLVQARVSSLTADAVIGHSRTTKTA